ASGSTCWSPASRARSTTRSPTTRRTSSCSRASVAPSSKARSGCSGNGTSSTARRERATRSLAQATERRRVAAAGLVVRAVIGEVDRADPGDDRLLRALVQPLAAAAHRDEELVEVRLERREHPVGPVLHLEPHLAGAPARLVDDLLRLALGQLDDLRLGRLANRLFARFLEEPVLLPLRLGQ